MSEETNRKESRESLYHNKMFIVICIASIVVAVGIFVLLINGYINKQYRSYEVLEETQRQDSDAEKYICRNGSLLKYSKDGISGTDMTGKTLWTGSYEMGNPYVEMCGDYIVAADIGGKDAMIYDKEHSATEISVDYEIKQARVSRQGLVALLLEDNSSNMINIYNPYDVSSKLLVKIPTNVDDGYPVAMALAPDGTSVVASYLCVVSGKLESRVVFYNFTDVGKNSDCIVGAKNYRNSLVTDIQYLDDDRVCLFADNGYYIWKDMKRPSQLVHKKVKDRIKSVLYDKDNIGLVLETGHKKNPYRMQIFDGKGTKKTDFVFNYDYNDIEMTGNEILFHSAKKCGIFRLNGVLRFYAGIEDGVDYFFPTGQRNRYYIFNDGMIRKIKLK